MQLPYWLAYHELLNKRNKWKLILEIFSFYDIFFEIHTAASKTHWNSGNKMPASQVAVDHVQRCLPDEETLPSVSSRHMFSFLQAVIFL